MHLIILLSFFTFKSLFIRISVFDRLQFLEKKLHSECLLWLPQQSRALPELKALVCGENFEQLHASQYYVSTGLIHLFVVSGTHFVLLKTILDFLCAKILFFIDERHRRLFILLLLFFYTAICEFNPPVVRAFCVVVLTSGFLFERIFWPMHFKTLCTGLLCLVLEPSWIHSFSLQLSWIIAIGISLSEILWKNTSALLKQAFLSFLIYPTLLLFQTPNPFSILINFCLTGILELFLFPLALIVCFVHFLSPLFDSLIEFLNLMLRHAEIVILPGAIEKSDRLILANWILISLLHLICHLLHITRKRTHATTD